MNREEWEQAFQEVIKHPESGKIERLVDRGFRHQSDQSPMQYLEHFLRVGRHFGYATHDDSWGEFEKEYAIIIRRLIMAEAACKDLMRSRFESDGGDPEISDIAYFEAVRLAREAVGDYQPERSEP